MELTQLKQFVAVAERGSLSEAAEHLYVSQPALSAMLKKLEGELGIALFHRTKNKITLNEAGELALQHAKRILAQAEQMKTELHDFSRRHSLFKVGFCDPGPMWFAVPKFAMMFPELELQPTRYTAEPQALSELHNGQFDLLINAAPNEDSALVCRPLCRDRLLLSLLKDAAPPESTPVSLRHVTITELALFRADGVFLQQNLPLFDAVKERIKITFFDDFFLFQQYLQSTKAATINTHLVQHYREDGGNRVLIPLTDSEADIAYYVIYAETNRERVKPLLQWLEAVFGGLE